MAGKSNKGKNRKAVQNSTSSSEQAAPAAPSDAHVNDTAAHAEDNGTRDVTAQTDAKTEAKESGNEASTHEAKQGEPWQHFNLNV